MHFLGTTSDPPVLGRQEVARFPISSTRWFGRYAEGYNIFYGLPGGQVVGGQKPGVEQKGAKNEPSEDKRCSGVGCVCGAEMIFSAGCASGTRASVNPSFPVSIKDADADLQRTGSSRKALERPLVVITGFGDIGILAAEMRARLPGLIDDRRLLAISVGDCWTFDACRKKVIAAVDKAFPSTDPLYTAEVDVIGCSMGGLVARDVSLPPRTHGDSPRRLRIARLFTISAPNRGAIRAAVLPLLLPVQGDMRPGSEFIRRLNQAEAGYPICSYVRLGDYIVGEENAALPGRVAWWVPTPFLQHSHNQAFTDLRILADILRRLRGEPPLTVEPAAPLPS